MRKAVQILHCPSTITTHALFVALCDDGSIFACIIKPGTEKIKWDRLPEIPQNDEEPQPERNT